MIDFFQLAFSLQHVCIRSDVPEMVSILQLLNQSKIHAKSNSICSTISNPSNPTVLAFQHTNWVADKKGNKLLYLIWLFADYFFGTFQNVQSSLLFSFRERWDNESAFIGMKNRKKKFKSSMEPATRYSNTIHRGFYATTCLCILDSMDAAFRKKSNYESAHGVYANVS